VGRIHELGERDLLRPALRQSESEPPNLATRENKGSGVIVSDDADPLAVWAVCSELLCAVRSLIGSESTGKFSSNGISEKGVPASVPRLPLLVPWLFQSEPRGTSFFGDARRR